MKSAKINKNNLPVTKEFLSLEMRRRVLGCDQAITF